METIKMQSPRVEEATSNIKKFFRAENNLYLNFRNCEKFEIDLDTNALQGAYDRYINENACRGAILDTLYLLSLCAQKDLLWDTPRIYQMLDDYLRSDLLKLYIMLYDNKENITWVSIRTKNGTIKLNNYCNWVMDDMIKGYLRKNLTDIDDLRQAYQELQKTKRKRGRIPNDPRLTCLMWGLYCLLNSYCEFKSPMPNNLCQFIIYYLQLIKIIPSNSEIDTFWVRAQLRYIQSKN